MIVIMNHLIVWENGIICLQESGVKWETFTLNAMGVVRGLSLNYHDQDKNPLGLLNVLVGMGYNTERIEQ